MSSTVSSISRQPSWRSSIRTPTSPSHYRGVQRGGFDTPSTVQEQKQPQIQETIFEHPGLPPPATEDRKAPTYNYKPAALRWWFLAVLVAILLALTAVTEHSIRSLPDYGLAYDLQRLGNPLSRRQFPQFRVSNATGEVAGDETTTVKTTSLKPTTSVLPPKTPAAAPVGPAVPVPKTSPTTAALPATASSASLVPSPSNGSPSFTSSTARPATASTKAAPRPAAPAPEVLTSAAPSPVTSTATPQISSSLVVILPTSPSPKTTSPAPVAPVAPGPVPTTRAAPLAGSSSSSVPSPIAPSSAVAPSIVPSPAPSASQPAVVPPVVVVSSSPSPVLPSTTGEKIPDNRGPPPTIAAGSTTATIETEQATATSEVPVPVVASANTPQSASSNTQRPNSVNKATKPTPVTTSICFGCTPTSVLTSVSAVPSVETVTSTIDVKTTISGTPTTVKAVYTSTTGKVPAVVTEEPVTTTFQQVTVLPDSTTVLQQTTTDSTGLPTTQAITTIIPGSTSTIPTAITLQPGQSWVTTARPVTTSLNRRPAVKTTIFTNEAGQTITSTYLVTLPPATIVVTSTYGTIIGGGRPTTAPEAQPAADNSVIIIGISRSEYNIASFLPTLLAVLLAMALRAIDINAKLFQPFVALASAPVSGVAAEASVFLRFYGWKGTLGTLPRAVKLRQPLVVISQLILGGAALLAPLAAEAVRVYVPDGCTGACPGSLGVVVATARALEVLLAILIACVVAMVVTLAFVKTGVRQNPWSVAGMASLGVDREMRELLRNVDRGVERKLEDWEVERAVERRGYTLGGECGQSRYGVRVADFPVMPSEALLKRDKDRAEREAKMTRVQKKEGTAMPLFLLTWQGRGLVLSLFVCVLVLLLYYQNNPGGTALGRFMSSRDFGARFLFTGVGVSLAAVMNGLLRNVAVILPYLLMSRKPLPAGQSILLSPPTNPFSGLYTAIKQRHVYLGAVSLATLLADFLPMTLSHVPFGILETDQTQRTCAYLTIAILMVMMVAVAGSLVIRWPHMPVDPRTVAGSMYYLCDSGMLDSFDGLAGVEMRDRDWMVKSMGVWYMFGTVPGSTGKARVGVESVGGVEGDTGA